MRGFIYRNPRSADDSARMALGRPPERMVEFL
jgi:hypothetical protein